MSSLWPDRTRRSPKPIDQLDRLPDSMVLLVLNLLADIKSLARCSAVSRRLHLLVPQTQSVLVLVHHIINNTNNNNNKHPLSLSSLLRLVLSPFLSLLPRGGGAKEIGGGGGGGGLTHHSPSHVLRGFTGVKSLRIEFPAGELGVGDGVFLKWRAEFGSTLHSCAVLGASSLSRVKDFVSSSDNEEEEENDFGSIPESFYTDGGLKLRVVWTISSLIAASARHFFLQPIISDRKTLDSLVLTDADSQGVLSMDKNQLEELREKPLSASSASKRTMVPALNMRLWYAPRLELADGRVMKGATLVAIRPREEGGGGERKEAGAGEGEWVSGAFEEPFGAAARVLVKRRTYCLEMNSF